MHKTNFKSTMKHYLLNSRPYSWIDLILMGFMAKIIVTKSITFALSDLWIALTLIALWIFYNLALEAKHAYAERGAMSIIPALIFLLIAIGTSAMIAPFSIIPLAISVIFVYVYLQKNRNRFFGVTANITRAIIEVSYFFVAVLLYKPMITTQTIIVAIFIGLLFIIRSLAGDIRDVKHNKIANKQTVPVVFGVHATTAMMGILTAGVVVLAIMLQSWIIAGPLILFMLLVIFHPFGYVIHQSSIYMTTFTYVMIIAWSCNINEWFILLIYAGILLNQYTYPLLKRKSNPLFVEERGE